MTKILFKQEKDDENPKILNKSEKAGRKSKNSD